MKEEEKIVRIIDLIKNGVSREDFEFFIKTANQYSDCTNAYGNQLKIDDWEEYFKKLRKKNSLDKVKIELIFNFLKYYYPNSFDIINKNIYAFEKGFPNNFDFKTEIMTFKTIELYKIII